MAKAAGMKYITITSKHHDGFAMYDSKVSDYDIVDRTPYGKDVLKLLAEECRKQGIKLFFYHSQLDWHHPDYFPRGGTGRFAGRDGEGRLEPLPRLHGRAAAGAAHRTTARSAASGSTAGGTSRRRTGASRRPTS